MHSTPSLRAACRFLAAAALALPAVRPAVALDLKSLQPNTWIEVKPKWKWPSVAKGGAFQERGWCTMRYRKAAGSIVFYEGYGPSDRGQYCIYANSLYEFKAATDTAEMLSLSNYYCNSGAPPSPLPQNEADPTPKDRHTYSQFAYSPLDDRLYLAHGASGSGVHPHDMWAWSFKDRKWENMGPAPGGTQGWELVGEANLILNSRTQELYLFRNRGSIHVYDVAAKTWRNLAPKGAASGVLGAHGAYDSKRDRFVFYGNIYTNDDHGTTNLVFFDAATSTWTEPSPAGAWPPAISYASMEYNSKWDVYMLHGGWQQNGTWIYSPVAGEWSRLATPASTPVNGKQMMLAYDEGSDVLVNSLKGTMYLLRYQGPGTTGAAAPAARSRAPARVVPGGSGAEIRMDPASGSRVRVRVLDLRGGVAADLGFRGPGEVLAWRGGRAGGGLYVLDLEDGLSRSSIPFTLLP